MTPWLRMFPLAAALAAAPAWAQTAGGQATPVVPQNPTPAPAAPTAPGYDSNLLGSIGGLRPLLAAHGITLTLTDLDDVIGNVSGGVRQGAIFEGLGTAQLQVDTEAAFGLAGGSLNVTAFAIYGRGLSANNLDNLQTVTEAEADRSFRLFEAWYEQSFLAGKITLRLGQQAADQEFIVSQYAALFFNSSFGFPALAALDLPGGGPAYPLATPAVRVKALPAPDTTLLLALFNGDPAPGGTGDPQRLNCCGTDFNLHGGALVFAELQRAINQGDAATGLAGTYKLGVWYHSGTFPDQLPASNGVPRQLRNNWSIYAVADQLLWRPPGARDGGIGGFIRAMGAPGDRNLVNVFVDGGLTWRAPFPGRPNDTAGIGAGWTRISDTARLYDAEIAEYSATPYPQRTGETVLELTYQATLRPWLQLQPDLQYVFNPGGGILNPLQPTRRLKDEAVLGLRTNITF